MAVVFMEDLDKQNPMIRKKALHGFLIGALVFAIGAILTIASYSSAQPGGTFVVTYSLLAWGLYRMFISSKFFVFGRHAVRFPKTKAGPTSSLVRGKIYKNKD